MSERERERGEGEIAGIGIFETFRAFAHPRRA